MFLRLKDNPNIWDRRTDMRREVKAGEYNALEMLVDLFDWLDGLKGELEISPFRVDQGSYLSELWSRITKARD